VTFTQSKRAAGRKKVETSITRQVDIEPQPLIFRKCRMIKLIKACLLELCPTMCKNRCKAPCHVGLDVKHTAHKARSGSNLKLVRQKDNDGSPQQGCSSPDPYNHTILDAASIHYCPGGKWYSPPQGSSNRAKQSLSILLKRTIVPFWDGSINNSLYIYPPHYSIFSAFVLHHRPPFSLANSSHSRRSCSVNL
jgi:hypothetical protein